MRVVVVILVVADKVLAEVSMQDVELVLGKELMGGGGHAVVGAVGVVGVIGVIGVIGVAGPRICGSGPATDAGQTGKVGIEAEAFWWPLRY